MSGFTLALSFCHVCSEDNSLTAELHAPHGKSGLYLLCREPAVSEVKLLRQDKHSFLRLLLSPSLPLVTNSQRTPQNRLRWGHSLASVTHSIKNSINSALALGPLLSGLSPASGPLCPSGKERLCQENTPPPPPGLGDLTQEEFLSSWC